MSISITYKTNSKSLTSKSCSYW